MNSCDARTAVINNYLLLRLILDNLNIKDLQRLRIVCKSWNDLILNITKHRNASDLVFYFGFRCRRKANRRLDELSEPYYKFIVTLPSILPKSKNFISNELYSKPRTCFVFSSMFSKLPTSLRNNLPSDCDLLCFKSSCGIIGSPRGPVSPIELDSFLSKLVGMLLFFVPRSNLDCEIQCFENSHKLEHLYNSSQTKPLKCVLLFSAKSVFKILPILNLISKTQSGVALGGIIIDEIIASSGGFLRKVFQLVVTISGNDVKSASLVLGTPTESHLLSFRESLDFNPDICNDNNQTFGLVFSCIGRSASFRKPNIESSLISKVFPKVRLMGLFGNGEFGHNFWPKNFVQEDIPSHWCLNPNLYDHRYTTILVLLNFNKERYSLH